MEVSPLRALTHLATKTVFTGYQVEMEVSPLRALTHDGSAPPILP